MKNIETRTGYFIRSDGVIEHINVTYENEHCYRYINIENQSEGIINKERVIFDKEINYNVSVDVTFTFNVAYSIKADDETHARNIALDMVKNRVDVNFKKSNTMENVSINTITKITL